jgi:hypothetical protein
MDVPARPELALNRRNAMQNRYFVAAWLAGSWSGTAFGSRIQEVWNPPSAGSTVGMFKLCGKDGVVPYELMTMTVEDGTLSLNVRHFDPDFTAWDSKDEYVNFRLVKKEATPCTSAASAFIAAILARSTAISYCAPTMASPSAISPTSGAQKAAA